MVQRCKLYVLVGVPGSGKSTWVNAQEWADSCCIISTDYWVEEEAKRQNKSYSDIFSEYMPTAVNLMAQNVVSAKEMGNDIIWDQTSTTIASRKRKFNMLPDYYAVAIVFRTPPRDELAVRLSSRPGKNVPDSVVQDMIDNWEEPSKEEGFDEIWYV